MGGNFLHNPATPDDDDIENWINGLPSNYSNNCLRGSQLQTLNDPSIYMGNEGLCGAPLPKGCPGDVPSFVNQSTKTSSGDDHEFFMWFYAGMRPGFFVGFIGVLSILLFARSWSYAYFKFLETAYNKIHGLFLLKVRVFYMQ
ncbi:PREDICTED: uncharacterized protein LOC109159850 [Ipomoea nil]|uniref:uncharacterized protein LOC109159850 n=1 Tax=Ipomoea nil TaxID=35883 RepID=UPI000900E70B|nr:PREDICTED: uncharacterized protein LOC109159850 [Ipomoea nil]